MASAPPISDPSASGSTVSSAVASHHATTCNAEHPELGANNGFGILEADPDAEIDSPFGDDGASYTTSLNSLVTDYKYENGRRYHAYQDRKYVLPNDDPEITRLELQHHIWRVCLSDRLNLAPLPKGIKNALDLGCGTGSWAIDFGEAHPDCKVVGTDLSPIQPNMVPPNVEFFVDDITSPWIYQRRFDYIHTRMLTIAMPDWSKLIEQCWKNLEPGGWVEFQEYYAPFMCDDGTMENAPSFKFWNDQIVAAANMSGSRLDSILEMPRLLAERGYANIGQSHTKWALGTWPIGDQHKAIGELFANDIVSALEGSSMRLFTKNLGWAADDVLKLLREVERDIRGGKMHAYLNITFMWAQKPLDAKD